MSRHKHPLSAPTFLQSSPQLDLSPTLTAPLQFCKNISRAEGLAPTSLKKQPTQTQLLVSTLQKQQASVPDGLRELQLACLCAKL